MSIGDYRCPRCGSHNCTGLCKPVTFDDIFEDCEKRPEYWKERHALVYDRLTAAENRIVELERISDLEQHVRLVGELELQRQRIEKLEREVNDCRQIITTYVDETEGWETAFADKTTQCCELKERVRELEEALTMLLMDVDPLKSKAFKRSNEILKGIKNDTMGRSDTCVEENNQTQEN